MDSIFPQGLDDENLALDMVKAGQEVMQKSIQKAAQKHVRTGSMAKSIKCSKPVINRAGDAVGRVKFYGKDKTECKTGTKESGLNMALKISLQTHLLDRR